MGKIALIANVGKTDLGISLEGHGYQSTANLPLFKFNNSKDVSTHEFCAELKRLKLEPTEIAMDLLVIAATMYAADTRISRELFGEDSWTRIIDLYIPVSDAAFWSTQSALLQKIFRFLTGDIWKIQFRGRADSSLKLSPTYIRKTGEEYETDTVCLFSGGMDSFIGAIDLLTKGVRPLLVGHAKSSDVSPYQETCFDALKKAFPVGKIEKVYAFIRIPKDNLFGSEDHSERGRSFLFLSLGAICASALQQSSANLVVPENGMISLNIPLTPLRIGSHSTRTTHPHYFDLMQQLFDNIQTGVIIQNPYQFKTKGEMLRECGLPGLVSMTETMSCSHPSGRWEGEGNGHCGYCVPCIIRQAAFKAAGMTDSFSYRNDIFTAAGLDVATKKGADIAAFKYIIEKINQTPEFLTASIRNTGPLGQNVEDYVNVYQRALAEVDDLINPIVLV